MLNGDIAFGNFVLQRFGQFFLCPCQSFDFFLFGGSLLIEGLLQAGELLLLVGLRLLFLLDRIQFSRLLSRHLLGGFKFAECLGVGLCGHASPAAIAHSMANAGAWSDMVRSIETRCLV